MPIIENSVSARATCRICNNSIDKDIPRVGIESIFRRDGNEYISYKWHHLNCVSKNMPDKLIGAELKTQIPDDVEDEKKISKMEKALLTKDQIEEVKKVLKSINKSGFAILPITKIIEPNKRVNVEAFVKKKMRPRMLESITGDDMKGSKIYAEFEGETRVIIAFEEHADVEVEKGDRIVVLNGKSHLASNESIEIHVIDDAELLVNPTDSEIEEQTGGIELYTSKEWDRPSNKFCKFEIAPSSRASCGYCEEKIPKGSLKIMKAAYIEVNDRKFSGHTNFHLQCIKEDEDGLEVLHEAVTRLDPNMLQDNEEELLNLKNNLPQSEAKQILGTLLN